MNFSIENLSEDFENKIQFYNRQKGNELIRNGKIMNLKEHFINAEKEFIEITGAVLSERDYSVYSAEVLINGNTSKIEDANCDCLDFYNNIAISDKYICKHISAILSKYIS